MNTKLQAAAEIIRNSAIEFLAAKHGTTEAAVWEAIEAGQVKVCEQFAKLVQAGIAKTLAMAGEGQISLA